MFQNPISDVQLWAAVRENDEHAFSELFRRYWLRLYKTANQYLKDRETSEEIVHDVFLNIWNRRKDLEIGAFPPYLLTAVRYQIYNRMRAAKAPLVYTTDDLSHGNASAPNQGANRITEYELHQEMQEHLKCLPRRSQEIFCLSRIDHLTNQEIACRLGISKRSVENQLTVALKHLRVCFKHLAVLILCYCLYG